MSEKITIREYAKLKKTTSARLIKLLKEKHFPVRNVMSKFDKQELDKVYSGTRVNINMKCIEENINPKVFISMMKDFDRKKYRKLKTTDDIEIVYFYLYENIYDYDKKVKFYKRRLEIDNIDLKEILDDEFCSYIELTKNNKSNLKRKLNNILVDILIGKGYTAEEIFEATDMVTMQRIENSIKKYAKRRK